ncbi:MAG: bifunctional DNA-formamidopyrimidine glycosylase/DNA-(apurinic or apyrimidinic site) lyase [Gemmatimonadaceae bacterium]
MPELPEVETAVRRLREAVQGKTVASASVRHPALRRRITPALLRSLQGARVASVDRRGKHQLVTFDDGRILHAHFRMAGDWHLDTVTDPLPRFARATIEFTDGSRVVLDDPRMLSTLDLHPADAAPDLRLGPEPSDKALTPSSLRAAFAKRRGPIKPVLLDQRIIAGLGNIYAAESLWRAKLSPLTPASELTVQQTRTLLAAIRTVLDRATGLRYTASKDGRFAVYDREGKSCRRCGTTIARVPQAGRSTYYCPGCQK